ncbi:MAG: hypothetical protein B7Y89_00560 [Novosphingobium sp. 32-60-15]|uniref:beta strand repeat-containing protein n=1 Tax=unclassified Novosphingobium TaxID=2644732 RepID=UPI000BDD7038|nr:MULTISPECIES: hypothetical protein [unclassified Novosphingobium]OYX64775.1 MAG: hypothetical protein B7Y89_00560 [Novosphingobium sp. 32-60-15]
MRPIPSLSRKLVSASSVAIATAMLTHTPLAQAQSFQGTATVVGGSANVSVTGTTTDISVFSDSAVLNWVPFDQATTGGAIDFQPIGTTATFIGASGQGVNIAVLNRIIPTGSTRPIQFNGTVNSEIQISGPPQAGGRIFFYSPGGIILGGTAAFDVGSLALTTLDLNYDTAGNFDTAGSYAFQQASVADSKVRVLNGAQISTTTSNSYVALVAPSVTNDGLITVDGSAALVAADAATINFAPNGLFDIQVTSGSSSTATVVANGGTITGPASISVNDFRRVYMVAVAKNDALTMAIGSGSTLGFDIAGAADVVGNAIVLSAGFDVVAGAPGFTPSAGGGSGQVSVTGGDANITTSFFAQANGGVNLGSSLPGGLNFASDVEIYTTGGSSSLFANAGGILNVVGNVLMNGDDLVSTGASLGKNVSIIANGGGVANLNGNVILSSQGFGADTALAGGSGGTGTGGLARIEASNGGQIIILGDVSLNASGTGGGVESSSGAGGFGLGGSASILATGTAGSFVDIAGGVSLAANGYGGAGLSCSTCLPAGGNATGGIVTVSALGAHALSISGSTLIDAFGNGGDASDGLAGSGTGGEVSISATNGADLTFHGFTVNASGVGGDGSGLATAGNGLGGSIDLASFGLAGGTATFNGNVALSANGSGGAAADLGGFAAIGTGGTIYTGARDGTILGVTGAFDASASGFGGFGSFGSTAGTGGQVTLDAQSGGAVSLALPAQLIATGVGGFNSDPGASYLSSGGLAEITLNNGAIQLLGGVLINAGGQGNTVIGNGPAGTGQGGTARIFGTGTSLLDSTGNVDLVATGIGGSTSGNPSAIVQGGSGTGGTASVVFTGGLATVEGNLLVDASGMGGFGSLIDATTTGGAGTGGLAQLGAGTALAAGGGSSIAITGLASVNADGTGGEGFASGAGIGGEVNISAHVGSLALDSALVTSRGTGGTGTVGGSGGAATGGIVNILAQSSNAGPSEIVAVEMNVTASAFGGHVVYPNANTSPGGAGGQAQGGSVLIAGTAGNGIVDLGSVSAAADAVGGDGGNGNLGAGGNGGNAFAGTVRVGTISGNPTGSLNTGSATFDSISAVAIASGGQGGTGDIAVAGAVGGIGGNAVGGTASLEVNGSLVAINGLGEWSTDAIGGDGGLGFTTGSGGNAVIGSANPALPAGSSALIKGDLVASDLIFTSTALGGTGSAAGTATKAGQAAAFLAEDSTISANSISLRSLAGVGASPNIVDPISMTNSTATISGLFEQITSSSTSLRLDQASITAAFVTMNAGNWLLDPLAPATLGTLTGTSGINLVSGLDLVAHANLATQSSLILNAFGRIDLGSLSAGGFVEVTAGTTLAINDASSGDSIELTAPGIIEAGNLTAATSVTAESFGNIVTGNIAAGTGLPTGANGDLNSVGLRSGGSVSSGSIFSASNLGIRAATAITTGQATAYDMLLLGGGSVSTGGLNASNRVLIANASMESFGLTAAGFNANLVFAATPVAPTSGPISISGPVSSTAFNAATQGAFNSGSITVLPSATGSGNLLINAGGTLTSANLQAANMLQLIANGAISSGSLRSNTLGVKVASLGGNVTTGAISGREDVLVNAAQALTVNGPINARDVILLSGNNIAAGPITAGAVLPAGIPPSAVSPASITNATGRVLIASNTMTNEAFLLSTSTDYSALLAAIPARVAGSVNIGGAVAGRFVSFSQGAMTGGFMSVFGVLEVEAGGLVTASQRWQASAMQIASADISIIDNGTLTDPFGRPILSGLRTTPTGSVSLVSIGTGPAIIGDGVTGTGYALSAAEIGLISTGELAIGAVDNSANPVDMLIGNLALTAGGTIGASNLAGTNGSIAFGTGNRQTQTPGGAIRIVGNVTGTGFAGTNVVEFATGRFELDAATGSLSLTQTGTALGGIIGITANNIHVASGTILDRLAADPFYTGHAADLNRPATVQRPEGVLRALGLDLYPTGTLYIQNTGTALDPAGFFADFDFTDLNPPTNALPASISVIVNGKWQTAAGIVSGFAARDLVVENADTLEFYTATSSVNACALDATFCVLAQEVDPIPAIASQIAIVSNNTLGSTPEFTEAVTAADDPMSESEEEAQKEAEAASKAEKASSPIAPPPQMIDSKPLEPQSLIEQPVAGSGNPSLIGSVVNENSAEGEAQ